MKIIDALAQLAASEPVIRSPQDWDTVPWEAAAYYVVEDVVGEASAVALAAAWPARCEYCHSATRGDSTVGWLRLDLPELDLAGWFRICESCLRAVLATEADDPRIVRAVRVWQGGD